MTPADLTDRQREVAALVSEGWPDKVIAGKLGISTRRVRVHVSSIAFLIQVEPGKSERICIALWWREHGSSFGTAA